jgi:poly(3-hydroxybutyrate) depolymerase
MKVTTLLHDRFSINNTYVMGLSNGGMMAQLMGCTYPKLFDGVINIVGMQPLGMSCIPKSPINLIIYGGALDKSTPPKAIKTSSGYLYEPMLSTLNSWANQFNCKDYKISQLSEPFKTEEMMYFNCNNDVILTSILNKEAGHSWPGITPNEGYCRTNIQSEIIYNECNDISIISGSKYLFDRVFGE